MTLQEQIELLKAITVSQTDYTGKLEDKINKQSKALKMAKEALELIAKPQYEIVGYLKNIGVEALATIEEMEKL